MGGTNMPFTMKMFYNDDIRRFHVAPGSCWKELRDKVFVIHNLTPSQFQVKVSDEEGKRVVINTEEELLETCSRLSGERPVLKVYLERGEVEQTESALPDTEIKVAESVSKDAAEAEDKIAATCNETLEVAAPVAGKGAEEESPAQDASAGEREQRSEVLQRKLRIRNDIQKLKKELKELRRLERDRQRGKRAGKGTELGNQMDQEQSEAGPSQRRQVDRYRSKRSRMDMVVEDQNDQEQNEAGPSQPRQMADNEQDVKETMESNSTKCGCSQCLCGKNGTNLERLGAIVAKHLTPVVKSALAPSADMSVQHPLVFCDQCKKQIVGPRYKCAVCINYDLCAACEAREEHDPDHILLKMKKPMGVKIVRDVGQQVLQAMRHFNTLEAETTRDSSTSLEAETTQYASKEVEDETTQNASKEVEDETTQNVSKEVEDETTQNASTAVEAETKQNASSTLEAETTQKVSITVEDETTQDASTIGQSASVQDAVEEKVTTASDELAKSTSTNVSAGNETAVTHIEEATYSVPAPVDVNLRSDQVAPTLDIEPLVFEITKMTTVQECAASAEMYDDFVVVENMPEEEDEAYDPNLPSWPSEATMPVATSTTADESATVSYPSFDSPVVSVSAPPAVLVNYPPLGTDGQNDPAEEEFADVEGERNMDMMAEQEVEKKRLKRQIMSLGFDQEELIEKCLEECGADIETIVIRLLGVE